MTKFVGTVATTAKFAPTMLRIGILRGHVSKDISIQSVEMTIVMGVIGVVLLIYMEYVFVVSIAGTTAAQLVGKDNSRTRSDRHLASSVGKDRSKTWSLRRLASSAKLGNFKI